MDSVCATMAAKRNCFCNVPYKVETDRQKSKTAKCGSVIDYKEGRLGCNLYAPVGDVAEMWDALAHSKRFNVYTLAKYPLVYEEEWPKCKQHSMYMALRKCSKIGSNKGRHFWACDVKKPNASCKSFSWCDSDNSPAPINSCRSVDREWLQRNGSAELRKVLQEEQDRMKIAQAKAEEEKRLKRKAEEEEEQEDEEEFIQKRMMMGQGQEYSVNIDYDTE